jgi:membrane-associated phospholipid phosphatase
LWNRVNRGWRPLLVAYPLVMAFTLVYTAEHYVVDILLGWALAAVVMFALNRYEAWRSSPPVPVRRDNVQPAAPGAELDPA